MPMAINIVIIDKREKYYPLIEDDLEDLISHWEEIEHLVDLERPQNIHDYIEDKYNHRGGVNRGHYPRKMGAVDLVIKEIEKDCQRITKNNGVGDDIKKIYLDSKTNYSWLRLELNGLLKLLNEVEEPEFKEVVLYWL